MSIEKKETGADFVEVLGQNELAGVDWVIWTTDRLVERLRESGCLHFDSSLNLEAIRALISGHIAGDLDRLRDYQPAISVSDGGGSDASRVSYPIWECGCGTINGVNLAACGVCTRPRGEDEVSSSANAQGPMEGLQNEILRLTTELHLLDYELYGGDIPLPHAPDRLLTIQTLKQQSMNANRQQRGRLSTNPKAWPYATPSLIKEQPATEPNDPHYGAWREADDLILFKIPSHEEFRLSNKAAERLFEDFAKICEKEAVTRNTAVLQKAREALSQLYKAANQSICEYGSARTLWATFVRDVAWGGLKGLLSEADGQSESASGVSSEQVKRDVQKICDELDDCQRLTERDLELRISSPLPDNGEQKENP